MRWPGRRSSHIAESADPGRLARDAYSYLHLPIVAAIIMVAIADDLLIAHPDEPLAAAGVAMMVGGPALYLVGESLVRLRMRSSLSRRRLVAVIALVLLGGARASAPDAGAVGRGRGDPGRSDGQGS
jgi:low temperature requirement protein LtrA